MRLLASMLPPHAAPKTGRIRLRRSLAVQNINLALFRGDLLLLVTSLRHRKPPGRSLAPRGTIFHGEGQHKRLKSGISFGSLD